MEIELLPNGHEHEEWGVAFCFLNLLSLCSATEWSSPAGGWAPPTPIFATLFFTPNSFCSLACHPALAYGQDIIFNLVHNLEI